MYMCTLYMPILLLVWIVGWKCCKAGHTGVLYWLDIQLYYCCFIQHCSNEVTKVLTHVHLRHIFHTALTICLCKKKAQTTNDKVLKQKTG